MIDLIAFHKIYQCLPAVLCCRIRLVYKEIYEGNFLLSGCSFAATLIAATLMNKGM